MAKLKTIPVYLATIISVILSNNFAAGHYSQYDIGTWNMRGAFGLSESDWRSVVGPSMRIRDTNEQRGIDVLALQESGSVPGSSSRLPDPAPVRYIDGDLSRPYASQNQWDIASPWSIVTTAFIYHIHRSNQFNVAIVSTQLADEVIVVEPANGNGVDRAAIGIRIANDYFFSLHARPNDNNDAPDLVNRIETDMVNVLGNNPLATWVILGDYNMQPTDLEDIITNNNIAPAARLITHTHGGTRPASGRNIDYAVFGSSQNNIRTMSAFVHVENGMFSDHVGVIFLHFEDNEETSL